MHTADLYNYLVTMATKYIVYFGGESLFKQF